MQQVLHFFIIAAALALGIYSIVLHELAHALAAFYLGDPTAKLQGRLTLNPVKHVDPFHTLLMPLMTYFLAGVIFGGAKPVPVNPFMFRNRRKGMMITGVAGPAMNLLILMTCVAVVRLCSLVAGTGSGFVQLAFLVVRNIFFYAGLWNLLLMIFNMFPVPPLDGSRLLAYLLPRDMAARLDELERYGLFFVLIFVVLLMRTRFFAYLSLFYGWLTGVIYTP